MLTLKRLKWSNCFSYGDNNVLDLDKEVLSQITGANGTGKTSIPLIVQEVLYGKNIKNIKKTDIANNKSGKKGYWINLTFSDDSNEYEVDLDRRSSLKIKLLKNGTDVSSHTSLGTYKTISDIIGIPDFKVFCQLIYQHSTDSLEFLTATDMNRKKFLINLLQLERYTDLHEHFKEIAKEVTTEISELKGSLDTITRWIDNNKDMNLIKLPEIEVPPVPDFSRLHKLMSDIANISVINKKINHNNELKDQLSKLDSKYYLNSAPPPPSPSAQDLRTEVKIYESRIREVQTVINKLLAAEGECPSCLQLVDADIKEKMIEARSDERDAIKKKLAEVWLKIPEAEEIEDKIVKYKKAKSEFEKLNRLIDNTLQSETLDIQELKKEETKLIIEKNKAETEYTKARAENMKIAAHNSKVDVVKEQLAKMYIDRSAKGDEIYKKQALLDILEVLKKTFGTNGLVSYKIESSVKELEKKINKYLAELTYFQIYFKLEGEKLNIEVIDDVGNVTSMTNLSSGERARVNLATVLSIRNILSSLTSTKLNFIFLDEVIGVLDAEGKEKLSEVLLQEDLNTFMVAHDWEHPLIPKVTVTKEHNISRIDQ